MKQKRKRSEGSFFEGLPMVDADQPLTVIITKRDLNAADERSPQGCAIAKACKRMYHTDVRVHLTRTYLRDGDQWVRFSTPEKARQEIVAFDRRGEFKPGEYTLGVMTPSEKLGVKKPRGPHKTTTAPRKVLRATGVRPSAPKHG